MTWLKRREFTRILNKVFHFVSLNRTYMHARSLNYFAYYDVLEIQMEILYRCEETSKVLERSLQLYFPVIYFPQQF